MSVMSNKWIVKDKIKVKEKKKPEVEHVKEKVNFTRSNMTKTLRGVRK